MAGPLALQGLSRPPKASPMRYVRFVSVAAAVVTMTGLAAAAARWSEVRMVVMPWTSGASATTLVAAAAPKSVPQTPARRGTSVVTVTPAEAVEVVTTPAPVAPPEVPAPGVAAAPVHHVAHPTTILASTTTRAALAPVAAGPSTDDSDADAPTVFRKANAALQSGDHTRAGEFYGLLLNRYPSAPEAHAALALFGRMLLDDGNANGALQCFDDYLRRGGALREEVMLGRALAFQRIGPRAAADEARAWTSLIDAYPGSVHAERARRRLSELARL